MGRALVILTGLILSTYLGGCARNTVGSEVDDGRVFFMTDIATNRLPGSPEFGSGYIRIVTTVEGFEEPFVQDIRSEANGRPFDLLGQMMKGGSEVTIETYGHVRGYARTDFIVDGNILIRVGLKHPTAGGWYSVWLLERF